MTIPRLVTIDAETFTLRQLAKRSGIAYPTICRRYHIGDRGEELIRPLMPGRQTKQQVDLAEMHDTHREERRREHAAKRAKEEARRVRLLELRALHAAELARPLISAGLLSRTERKEIRENVVGRQRWWTADSAYIGR